MIIRNGPDCCTKKTNCSFVLICNNIVFEIKYHIPIKIPAAINVSLFRPYLWESRNPIMLLSAIESSILLYLTFRLFQKRKLKNTIDVLSKDVNLQFFLLFGLIFSFFVGITTYNFGSLVRYKIQGYPFYIAAILLLYYLQPDIEKRKHQVKNIFLKKNTSLENRL